MILDNQENIPCFNNIEEHLLHMFAEIINPNFQKNFF